MNAIIENLAKEVKQLLPKKISKLVSDEQMFNIIDMYAEGNYKYLIYFPWVYYKQFHIDRMMHVIKFILIIDYCIRMGIKVNNNNDYTEAFEKGLIPDDIAEIYITSNLAVKSEIDAYIKRYGITGLEILDLHPEINTFYLN